MTTEQAHTPATLALALCAYHPGNGTELQNARFQAIRGASTDLVAVILEMCPCSPDRTTAVQLVRDAMQRAIASLVVPQGAVATIAHLGRA